MKLHTLLNSSASIFVQGRCLFNFKLLSEDMVKYFVVMRNKVPAQLRDVLKASLQLSN